jgi:hypothetical protein
MVKTTSVLLTIFTASLAIRVAAQTTPSTSPNDIDKTTTPPLSGDVAFVIESGKLLRIQGEKTTTIELSVAATGLLRQDNLL